MKTKKSTFKGKLRHDPLEKQIKNDIFVDEDKAKSRRLRQERQDREEEQKINEQYSVDSYYKRSNKQLERKLKNKSNQKKTKDENAEEVRKGNGEGWGMLINFFHFFHFFSFFSFFFIFFIFFHSCQVYRCFHEQKNLKTC